MLDIVCVCKPKETVSSIFFKCGEYKTKWYPQWIELKHTEPNLSQTVIAVLAA
jgi:hypothetical protein